MARAHIHALVVACLDGNDAVGDFHAQCHGRFHVAAGGDGRRVQIHGAVEIELFPIDGHALTLQRSLDGEELVNRVDDSDPLVERLAEIRWRVVLLGIAGRPCHHDGGQASSYPSRARPAHFPLPVSLENLSW